jgi:hypothetical protein
VLSSNPSATKKEIKGEREGGKKERKKILCKVIGLFKCGFFFS